MADSEDRIIIQQPNIPGAAVVFQGENARKDAAAYRKAQGLADDGSQDNPVTPEEKAAELSANKARTAGENK